MSRTRIPLSSIDEIQGLKQRLEMNTADLGLTVRTTNCLEKRGIFTVAELLNATREKLLSDAGFGEKTLVEIYNALERIGFHRPRGVAIAQGADWEVDVTGPVNSVEALAQPETGPSSKNEAIDPIPIGVARSLAAFRRDLSELLRQSQGKWVAYHHDKQIGVGGSKSLLYQECLTLGLSPNDFIVRRVVPDVTRCVEEGPL
jgi:DNA-directed RNA polymerase subunit alpha